MRRWIILLTLLLICIFQKEKTFAEEMSNDSYTLTTDITEEKQNGIVLKNGKPQQGIYQNSSYSIVIGKENDEQKPFALSISPTILLYNDIIPGESITRSLTVNIEKGGSNGYSLKVSEDKNLSDINNVSIPDTSCDTGNCSEVLGGTWENPLTYGLGYSCKNDPDTACLSLFENGLNFRSFANISKQQRAQTVLIGNTDTSSQLLIKVNKAPTLPSTLYSNVIDLIAVPNL